MKTIIAGVDFSKSSYNAAQYACMLAQKSGSKLTLFNMYDIPLIHSNSGLYYMSFTPVREESEHKMAAFCKKLKKTHPKLTVDYFVSSGFFKQEINSFVKKHEVQCVVIGLSSKDRFSKFIYGSHSTDIAGKIDAPVIIVPDNFKKHSLRKVLLGVDNDEKLHRHPLHTLENFLHDAKAGVDLLHVQTEDEIFDGKHTGGIAINGKQHKVDHIAARDIEKGIRSWARKKKSDLVAIISKKHSPFYNLFYETNTKKIAFASKLPVMAIHE